MSRMPKAAASTASSTPMTGLQRLATTIAGVAAEGMVRGGGRLFLDLGRRIERAMLGGYVLAAVLDQPPQRIDGTLRMALELCDSAITYRSRYLSVLQPAPSWTSCSPTPATPRALAFQFAQAATLLAGAGDADLAESAQMLHDRVAGLVDHVLHANDPAEAVAALPNALIGLGNGAAGLSDRITRRFFALLPKLQSVGLETA